MNSKLFPIIPFAMIIAKVPSAFIFAKKSGHIMILPYFLTLFSSQQTNINSNTKCCFAIKVLNSAIIKLFVFSFLIDIAFTKQPQTVLTQLNGQHRK